jgi:hypothetical protein
VNGEAPKQFVRIELSKFGGYKAFSRDIGVMQLGV